MRVSSRSANSAPCQSGAGAHTETQDTIAASVDCSRLEVLAFAVAARRGSRRRLRKERREDQIGQDPNKTRIKAVSGLADSARPEHVSGGHARKCGFAAPRRRKLYCAVHAARPAQLNQSSKIRIGAEGKGTESDRKGKETPQRQRGRRPERAAQEQKPAEAAFPSAAAPLARLVEPRSTKTKSVSRPAVSRPRKLCGSFGSLLSPPN